jgi:hypothetical protein
VGDSRGRGRRGGCCSGSSLQELGERMAELEKREADYKARVEDLEREVAERDEMISFISILQDRQDCSSRAW